MLIVTALVFKGGGEVVFHLSSLEIANVVCRVVVMVMDLAGLS